ncbi:hypothetical protein [Rubritalea tangerina]
MLGCWDEGIGNWSEWLHWAAFGASIIGCGVRGVSDGAQQEPISWRGI